MPRILVTLLGLLLAATTAVDAAGEQYETDDIRSLDEQVQEIKSDVLNIAAELDNLEERLLYPSGTQVAVFVAMNGERPFRLDAVRISIDGEPAAHHIYSFKELEALEKGGVQRIYTGNIPTGDHELSVSVIGKLKNGKDFSESSSFTFAKGVEPKTLGLTLDEPGAGGISLGAW